MDLSPYLDQLTAGMTTAARTGAATAADRLTPLIRHAVIIGAAAAAAATFLVLAVGVLIGVAIS